MLSFIGKKLGRLFRPRHHHYLTLNVWKARDEWVQRVAREAMDPQLAEIHDLPEAEDK